MKRTFIIFLHLWLNSYNQASDENSNLLIPRLVLYELHLQFLTLK